MDVERPVSANNLVPVVSWIAAAVALVVVLILPTGYFVVSYQAIGAQLNTEVQFRSGMISQFIGTNPDLWQFDRHHLEELLSRDPPLSENQTNQLLLSDGKLIAAMGGAPQAPVMSRTFGVFDAGVPVGELRIVHSIRSLWTRTAIAALIGLLLGAAVFIALRVFPLHALERVTEALRQEIAQHDRARAAAETANRAKSQFLAAASHDLRQPLHALGLFAASLSEKERSPEVRAIVENISASVEALEALFNELLDISKLDAGVIQPSLASFPVNPLFDRLRLDYEPEAREKGLRLRIVPSTVRVYSDPTLIERMLRNLIVNAIRYTDKGGVVVGCRPRGDRYSLEVWDSGVGIPADKLDKIFEEFYQVGNPERDRRKGLGLGLAIVKRVEQLLGYQMQVASRPGRGSVFRFTLPRGRTETLGRDSMARTEGSARGLQDKCVVVVDDELTVREGMKALLSGWGCDVIAADSLGDALQRIGEHARRPDAIIADYRLREGATGIEVIQTLHTEFGRDIPALLITGDTAADRLREVRESGYPQLHKPVPAAKLREVLNSMFAVR